MLRAILMSLSLVVFFSLPLNAHDVAKEMSRAAEQFFKSLDEQQRKTIQFGFDDELRKNWQFIPMERQGLGLKAMKGHQRGLAMSLVQSALSHDGFSTAMQIMALEDVLRQLENNPVKRDPEKYHLFFFGEPGLESNWGWRVEGHHLSITVTIVKRDDGQVVSVAPSFFGTNPARIQMGPMNGTWVLGNIETLGRQLAKKLTVEQKKKGILEVKVPKDVILGPNRDAVPLSPAGISLDELSADQQSILMKLLENYLGKFRKELIANEWEAIKQTPANKIRFAWIGKLKEGEPHYFRVQGPTFVLEYDNTQNKANHAHLVWRDLKNDFGADALKRHYEKSHGAKVEAVK